MPPCPTSVHTTSTLETLLELGSAWQRLASSKLFWFAASASSLQDAYSDVLHFDALFLPVLNFIRDALVHGSANTSAQRKSKHRNARVSPGLAAMLGGNSSWTNDIFLTLARFPFVA